MNPGNSIKRLVAFFAAFVLSLTAVAVAGYSRQAAQQQAQQAKNVKRYHLVGKIVSINPQQNTLMVI
ncbi:MAG: hypothetical protein WBQ34_05190 [Candidatus Acidiferrales bacterium]